MRDLDTALGQLGWDRVQVFVVSDGPLDEAPEDCFPANPIQPLAPEQWAGYDVDGTQGLSAGHSVTYSSPTAAKLFPGHRNVQIRAERLRVHALR